MRVGTEDLVFDSESLSTEVGTHAWEGYHFECIRELSRSEVIDIALCITQSSLPNQALFVNTSGIDAYRINDQALFLNLACTAFTCAFSSFYKQEDARGSLLLVGWENVNCPLRKGIESFNKLRVVWMGTSTSRRMKGNKKPVRAMRTFLRPFLHRWIFHRGCEGALRAFCLILDS